MRFASLLLFFASLLPAHAAYAGEPEHVTLPEILSRAASHPSLLIGEAEIARREAAVRLAGERGPTTVAIEAENAGGRFPGFSESEATIALKRPLLDGRRNRAAREVARADLDQARQAARNRLWLITSAAQTAFHRAIVRDELERTASEAVYLAERGLDAARARVEAGAAPGSEILKAQVELERARVERERASSQVRESRNELARAVGQAESPLLCPVGSLGDDISLPGREELIESMLAFHPDLRELDAAENHRKARVLAADAGGKPIWAAGGGFRRFQEDDRHTFVIELEAELPDRRTVRREQLDLAGEGRRIEAERAARRLDLEHQIDGQITRFNGAKTSVERLGRGVLPDTRRLMEMALEAYRLGRADQLEVIEAQKAHLDSRREHIEALAELYEAADAIENLCGICLVGEKH
ncbi:MAG TPA: TolC family protein [Candidatus Ozemobacteraceae bacterium]|nr:TolC family protein [Candidatus Ozemobacteraceae bacterium]